MPPETLTYRITTLGCRVNHAETRDLASVLLSRGLAEAPPALPPDLAVVHTCSVTGPAGRKSRQAARRVAKSGAQMTIITGCYASTHTAELRGLFDPSETAVLPHHDPGADLIERFAEVVDRWLEAPGRARGHGNGSIRRSAAESSPDLPLPLFHTTPRSGSSRHIRAELKIQDGCDAHCTFCILPSIRPTLRSKSIADATEEARRLVELGHREIVLSGIFIGAYGQATALRRRQPTPRAEHLADLLDAVAQVPGLHRLRISSMEPGDVSDALIEAMLANAPIVAPHLHLPLQSGSDAILRRMNRQYRLGEYLEMVDRVNDALTIPEPTDAVGGIPGPLPPAITTDIICGFPGETEADFEKTVEVARRVGFLHMHVFPFSPRAGTAAARWRDAFVPERIKRQRVRRLIDLEEDPHNGLALRFRQRLQGRDVRLIIERERTSQGEPAHGRCDHYVRVAAQTDAPRGAIVHARVSEVSASDTIALVERMSIPLPVLG